MKIVIIYGSENDKGYMAPGRDYLEERRVPYEEKVLSVHRNTDELLVYLAELKKDISVGCVIAVAGLAAALPGVVAVKLDVPVIGVPVVCGPLNGIDALLAIVQSPGDVPVVSVGLHKKASLNAVQFAERILRRGRAQ